MEILPDTIGIFYPECETQLLKLFNSFNRKHVDYSSRLIIVPHAGYEFSGEIAFGAYSRLDKNVSNVLIIAPAVYAKILGSISCDATSFKTPLGSLGISAYKTEINNKLFVTEPAISIQLPFIKYFFPKASVTPILYGCEDYHNIAQIIDDNIDKSVIIIVSNLSRFVPERESIKLDSETIRKIERLHIEDLDMELADGAIGICGAIQYAKKNGLKFIRTGYSNSAKFNDDTSKVVGYGGWYLTR